MLEQPTEAQSERRSGTGGWQSLFHLGDVKGSTLGVATSSGGISDIWGYDSFGNVSAHNGSTTLPFGYNGGSGYQSDPDTGLMLLGHRYYDSSIGRFLSRDPAGAGENWYAYCDNDPINGSDPTGLNSFMRKSNGDYARDAGGHFIELDDDGKLIGPPTEVDLNFTREGSSFGTASSAILAPQREHYFQSVLALLKKAGYGNVADFYARQNKVPFDPQKNKNNDPTLSYDPTQSEPGKTSGYNKATTLGASFFGYTGPNAVAFSATELIHEYVHQRQTFNLLRNPQKSSFAELFAYSVQLDSVKVFEAMGFHGSDWDTFKTNLTTTVNGLRKMYPNAK